ncbi:MAG: DUF4270 domain-containing protein [Prevotella sp.]|nr:DUF4270 domain-containing protein [Prevotella sp.]
MTNRKLLTAMILTALSFAACSDDTFDFGNTLTAQADKLDISDTVYQVTTRSVLADSVLLRSSKCYLGRVKDPETGAYVTSEMMTQFNVLNTYTLTAEDKITSRFDDDMAGADSCQIELYMSTATGITDTLAALKIRLTELSEPLEENVRYYSNYDPVKAGKTRSNGLVIDKMFSYNDLTVSDSLRATSNYYNCIVFKLNKPYTAKDGTTYNNYGTYLMQQYYRHPEYFRNSYAFTHNVCPGFYVSVHDGEGVYTEVPDMALRFFYKGKNSSDSIVSYSSTVAGTEEVLQTTKIINEKAVLEELQLIDTCTYLKAPAGLYTEVTLPVDDIFKGHENDSIMTAKIGFQRINNVIKDDALSVPPYILMLPTDSLSSFFEKKKLTDNATSFYAAYAVSSGYANQYSFANISNLISSMYHAKKAGGEQWTAAHPNWNKVLLVPVQLKRSTTSSTTSTVTGIEHYVGIASTKLVGGSRNGHAPITLDIVYGKFKQ